MRGSCRGLGTASAVLAFCAAAFLAVKGEAGEQQPPDTLKKDRRAFQEQELITAKPYTYIFNAGEPPRIVWRDAEAVRRLGGDPGVRVRWFGADLDEVDVPRAPGRWTAYVEGTAPNGTPLRRAMTFYCRPPGWLIYFPPEQPPEWAYQPGPIAEPVWREHAAEFPLALGEVALRSFADSEQASIVMAGLTEATPLGHRARPVDYAAVRNDDHHLALKLKLLGLAGKARPLRPPQTIEGEPAPVLREGSAAEAGMAADAKARIDAVCRAWAEDTGEPFVTLVARRGVIVTHAAFGKDKAGDPISLDYRCQVFSITKTVTAMLFSRFIDQDLIGLDDRVSAVFPDYPKDSPRVPTFRQCFTHTSGLTGHGDFGAMRNPHFENVILNGIDANEPGKTYEYSGTGFDLAAKAMEIVAGQCAARLYHEHLFRPLGLEDALITDANAGAHLTARELATLAQWILNRGSYGAQRFISPKTFEQLLPVPVQATEKGFAADEGIGMHWMRNTRAGAPPHSKRPEDWIFSPRAIGHGSFSGCLFACDLDHGLLVVQARREQGPHHGEWTAKLFQAAADGLARPR